MRVSVAEMSGRSSSVAARLAMMVVVMIILITQTQCFSINQTITISYSAGCDGRNDDLSCLTGQTDLDSDEFMLDSEFSRRILAKPQGQARPTHLQIFLKPPHHQITISTLSPVNSASTNHIPPSPYFLSSQLSSILILNQQQPTPIYLNSSSRLHRSHLKSSFAQPLSYLNFSATIASSITAVHQFDLSSNAVTPSQLPDHRLGNSQLFNPQQTITAVTLNLSGNPAQPRGSIPPV
ncbi:hypothetical protein M0R45_025025 [Rubus argutus]|uniref:Uncharacterized protein n=1 Tax=Rubus argutus TaxID=59490 RepID=A0AAW1WUV3_RUBAR